MLEFWIRFVICQVIMTPLVGWMFYYATREMKAFARERFGIHDMRRRWRWSLVFGFFWPFTTTAAFIMLFLLLPMHDQRTKRAQSV